MKRINGVGEVDFQCGRGIWRKYGSGDRTTYTAVLFCSLVMATAGGPPANTMAYPVVELGQASLVNWQAIATL